MANPIFVRRRLPRVEDRLHPLTPPPGDQRDGFEGLERLESPQRPERIETGVAADAHRRPVRSRGLIRIVRMSATRLSTT